VLAGGLAVTLAVAAPAVAGIPLDLGDYDATAITYSGGGSPFEEAGAAVAGGCDVTGDGVDDTIVGAPSANANAGRVYVVPGRTRTPGSYDLPAGGAGAASGAIAIEGLPADPDLGDHQLGNAVACAGDVNDDGRDDLLLGARGLGGVAVVFGGTRLGAAQSIALNALGDDGFLIDAPWVLAATSVAAAGDVDGDGFDDVAIGAETWLDVDAGFTTPGAVFVVPGKDADTDKVDLSDGTAALFHAFGAADGDALGAIAPAGDVDGDGRDDFVVGARRHDGPNGTDSGAAYVIDGDARGKVELGGASAGPGVLKRVWGPAANAQAGGAVAAAGTVASAGIAVGMGQGAVLSTPVQHRRVWVVRGASQTVDLAAPGANGYAITGLTTVNGSDEFGRALAPAGDLDGDSLPDLAIGARGVTGAGSVDFAGAAFLVYGQAGTADRAISSLTCEQGARLFATQIQTHLGAALAVVPGATPQLLIGAPGSMNGNFARVIPLADMPGACGEDREPTADLDLDFGFRENFRGYVFRGFDAANPAVPIAATAGATCDVNPDGVRGGCDPRSKTPTDPYGRRALRWTPVGAGATDGSDTTIATIGMVTFRFPNHFFTLRIRDPWVVVSGGTATLRARVTLDVTDGFGGARPADVRVNLGTYPLAGPAVRAAQFVQWRTEPGTLTDEAWAALGGSFLGRAAELDPITLAIPRSLGALPEEPTVPRQDPPREDPPRSDPPRQDPPRRDRPRGAVATFKAGASSATVRRRGSIRLGTVVCRVQRCRVSATRSVRVRVARSKRGRARFVALRTRVVPATLARGRSAQLRLIVSRAAAKALAGRSVRVKVKIRASGDGRPLAKTVTVTLRGARPSSIARRR
jgi:hypothetical protein